MFICITPTRMETFLLLKKTRSFYSSNNTPYTRTQPCPLLDDRWHSFWTLFEYIFCSNRLVIGNNDSYIGSFQLNICICYFWDFAKYMNISKCNEICCHAWPQLLNDSDAMRLSSRNCVLISIQNYGQILIPHYLQYVSNIVQCFMFEILKTNEYSPWKDAYKQKTYPNNVQKLCHLSSSKLIITILTSSSIK